LGPDFPLICRITGDDYVEGGIRLENASATAALLVDSGADSIHVSVGISDKMVSTPPMSFPKGCFVHLAEGIKRAVDVPVIAVGRIGDIRFAENILAERKADYIAMGRALIADPHLPRKGEMGEDDNILPCIYCNQGCITTVKANRPISCLVNPGAGREAEFEIEPASPPKRVLIAGAGPAGLEASRTSALRGHRVSLYEKSGAIGGQLGIAWIPPHKMEVKRLLDYYQVQMEKLGVDLHLNSELTPGLIEEIHPDILVIATGSIPKIPEVPGFGTTDVKLAVDILKDRIRITGRVIVLGSRRVAMETAEYMMETATEVTLLGRADGVGLDLPQRERLFFLERLAKKGIKIIRSASVMEIQKKGVLFRTGGKDVFHNADHIVLAWGFVPNQSLIRKTELMTGHLGIKVYVAGDCIMPRNALEAIHEGARIGIAI
jgi:NADPH-dependent 2,4-dienoyl-CoA reductase/sulfur reductase-like enzyme